MNHEDATPAIRQLVAEISSAVFEALEAKANLVAETRGGHRDVPSQSHQSASSSTSSSSHPAPGGIVLDLEDANKVAAVLTRCMTATNDRFVGSLVRQMRGQYRWTVKQSSAALMIMRESTKVDAKQLTEIREILQQLYRGDKL